jgi:hypothetical protein
VATLKAPWFLPGAVAVAGARAHTPRPQRSCLPWCGAPARFELAGHPLRAHAHSKSKHGWRSRARSNKSLFILLVLTGTSSTQYPCSTASRRSWDEIIANGAKQKTSGETGSKPCWTSSQHRPGL